MAPWMLRERRGRAQPSGPGRKAKGWMCRTSALPLALRIAWRARARSPGLIGGRGSADVIHGPPPQQRGGGRAGYSERIDGQRDRETGTGRHTSRPCPGRLLALSCRCLRQEGLDPAQVRPRRLPFQA